MNEPLPGSYSETVEIGLGAPKRPRRRAGAAIGAVGILLIGGAATIVATRSSSGSDGAGSPEAAAKRFVEAIGKKDLLGAADALTPSERTLVARIMTTGNDAYTRLAHHAPIDLHDVTMPDLSTAGITYSVRTLTPDIADVDLRGGTLTAFDDAMTKLTGTDPADPATADKSHFVTVVRDHGSWYVSLNDWLVEEQRADSGWAAPTAADVIPATGSDTPQAAVENTLKAAAALDVHRLIQLAPPGELRALHDYGQTIAGAVKTPAGRYSLTIDTLTTSVVRQSGSEAWVGISAFGFTLHQTNADGSTLTESVAMDGKGCYTLTTTLSGGDGQGGAKTTNICPNAQSGAGAVTMPDNIKAIVDRVEAATKAAAPGITVTQVDGRWYIAPVQWLSEVGGGVVGVLQPADITAFKDFISSGDYARVIQRALGVESTSSSSAASGSS